MSHFNPGTRAARPDVYDDNYSKMAGAKANFTTALRTSEVCMNKCSVTDATPMLSDGEQSCLRQCFVKYFDTTLLIQNEQMNFTRTLNL